ncbi:MAG: alanine--glyoxylate aminotransferase family protein [Limnochordia bacterium]|nr:alanine--glyoxylate aminotransferase family protein [Limnochordia bacterium]MDD2629710.1 alanine--glyoxylate aminotransferase family protein [Limnochordia bacterium]MDD4517543.1 alanine--glyoxylate aminotransferase family protein [Limnochordia bacterium]
MFEEKKDLRIPGPSPVPPRVLRATSKPMMGHRSSEFKVLYADVVGRLKPLFGTEEDVMVITGSGTAAMEAAVANTVSPKDKVLVCVGGKFGERWALIAESYGAEVITYEYDWSTPADPAMIAKHLQENPDIKVIFATQNETSSTVLNDIEGISKARGGSDALLVVDAVSSLGGAEFNMDQWGVDITVTGSQKCLMLPPGFAFIACSKRAWKVIEGNTSPRYYLDLRAYLKEVKKGQTPFTPNVQLVYGLAEVLDMLQAEGLPNILRRHKVMRRMTRTAFSAMGLELFVKDEKYASPTVTAVVGAGKFDVEGYRKVLNKEFGIVVAGGQDHLKGQILRVGHMGYSTPIDMLGVIATMEVALKKVGCDLPLGAGIKAAQEVLAE